MICNICSITRYICLHITNPHMLYSIWFIPYVIQHQNQGSLIQRILLQYLSYLTKKLLNSTFQPGCINLLSRDSRKLVILPAWVLPPPSRVLFHWRQVLEPSDRDNRGRLQPSRPDSDWAVTVTLRLWQAWVTVTRIVTVSVYARLALRPGPRPRRWLPGRAAAAHSSVTALTGTVSMLEK